MTEIHAKLAAAIAKTKAALIAAHICLNIIESSFREYSVQAEITDENGQNIGGIILYFSPKRGAFTVKPLHKLSADTFANIKSALTGQQDETFQKKAETSDKFQNNISGKQGGTLETKTGNQKQCLDEVHGYVDGSFLNGKVGYGLVIVQNGSVIFELSGGVSNPEYVAARQVAGELFAVGKVVQWCKANSVKNVEIFYDYAGIEAWATGKWKAKLTLTNNYREFIRTCGLAIRWRKVAAHTGDKWNEHSDSLAKRGALHGS